MKTYSIEVHVEGSPEVMQLRDCNETFIRRMIYGFVMQTGYDVEFDLIQIPDDANSHDFVAKASDGDLQRFTVIYTHAL